MDGVGFSFDLGGKTSLGRHYEERNQAGEKYGTLKYELIGAPSHILDYLEDKYFAVDRLLPVEVAHCLHIAGEPTITDRYKQLLQKRFLQQEQNGLAFHQKRALEHLKGNRYLESDLQKFNPFKMLDGESKLVDVKNEIYRPLDRLVDDLALYHGIYVESTWDKITALADQNIIHPNSAPLLKILHTIALEMRLKTYHHYGRQMESVGLSLPLFADNPVAFHQGQKRLLERFYATILPFHKALKAFSNTQDKKLLQCEALRDDSLMTTSSVLIRLGEYKEAESCLNQLSRTEKRYLKDFYFLDILQAVYELQGRTKEQYSVLETALGMDKSSNKEGSIRTAHILMKLASAYSALGKAATAKSYIERALEINEDFYGSNHVQVARTLGNLASTYRQIGDPFTAKKQCERALKILEQFYKHMHSLVAKTLVILGTIYKDLGDSGTAKSHYMRALKIEEKLYGPDHIQVAKILDNLGNAYRDLGDVQAAKSHYEKSLKIAEKLYGSAHVKVANTLVNLGTAYRDFGDAVLAKSSFEKALEIEEKFYGTDHVKVAVVLVDLGNAYSDLGDGATAKRCYKRALKIEEKFYGPNHVEVAKTMTSLGAIYGISGDASTAKSYLERALKIKEKFYGVDHIIVAMSLMNLGNVDMGLGEVTSAKGYYEKALKIKEKFYGPGHLEVARALGNIAIADFALQEFASARELSYRGLQILRKLLIANPTGTGLNINIAHTLSLLSKIEALFGNFVLALEQMEEAKQLLIMRYGAKNLELFLCDCFNGFVSRLQENATEADRMEVELIASAKESLGPNDIVCVEKEIAKLRKIASQAILTRENL